MNAEVLAELPGCTPADKQKLVQSYVKSQEFFRVARSSQGPAVHPANISIVTTPPPRFVPANDPAAQNSGFATPILKPRHRVLKNGKSLPVKTTSPVARSSHALPNDKNTLNPKEKIKILTKSPSRKKQKSDSSVPTLPQLDGHRQHSHKTRPRSSKMASDSLSEHSKKKKNRAQKRKHQESEDEEYSNRKLSYVYQ
jgi:hypothetical protein